jgi:hypothetical protein
VVDLSARIALDEALSFFTRLGYRTVRRTDTAIIVRRTPEEGMPTKMPAT